MADYVVGDIQGCYQGLISLLEHIAFDPANDRLFAVGDLIARGPQSLETLEFLHSLGECFGAVLGNHDLHFLAVHCGIKPSKSSDLLAPLLSSHKREMLVDWLRQMPLAMMLDEDTLMAHAGLYPGWSIQQAVALSAEVSGVLQSDNWQALITSMYGSDPRTWQDDLDGDDRLRFIINALTRMRFIQAPRQLDFACKLSPDEAPEGLQPWFALANPSLAPQQRIIFGHWAALMGNTPGQQFVALDTGYVWGNAMTCINLQSNQRFSVNAIKN